MKSHTAKLVMQIRQRMDFVNITRDVEAELEQSGIQEGLCLVNAMHITASVFINDDESGLHRDYKRWLEELAPFDPSPERYHHNRTGEDNADAHHKRQIMGARWSSPSPTAGSTSAHGSRSSTASSTAADPNASWSRSSASKLTRTPVRGSRSS